MGPKYQCSSCGHVYDPAEGDSDNDIPSGTPFADIMDVWICPDCGAPKADFQRVPDDLGRAHA